MIYETFLFTRNTRRDFTAFVRPQHLTNKDISLLASALNHVGDVSALPPNWPALYSLPIGEYHLLLRHYDSGRKHAGRSIGVVEGIAVRREFDAQYAQALPHLLTTHRDLLSVATSLLDIEAAAPQESGEHEWDDLLPDDALDEVDDVLLDEFVAQLEGDRLFLPFTQDGRALLVAALSDPRLRIACFAFGTNSEVVNRLSRADISPDIVSYFNTEVPMLRSRQTNEITHELSDFVARLPPRPPGRIQIEADPDYPTEVLPDPRIVRREWEQQRSKREVDPLAEYDAGEEAMLTMREMRQRERERSPDDESETEVANSRGWLYRIVARLLGRSAD